MEWQPDATVWHVLDAMADDWESADQIEPPLARFVGPTSRAAIFSVLRELHRRGMIRLMNSGGYAEETFPPDPEGYWFSITDLGRECWDRHGSSFRDE